MAGTPDAGRPTTLLLLRHGAPSDPTGRVWGGDGPGPGLGAPGRAQVTALAGLLVGRPGPGGAPRPAVPPRSDVLPQLEALLSSPVRRARESAEELAGPLGLPPVVADAWAEVRLGDWHGLTTAEIATRWPAEFSAWQGATDVTPPGGESFDTLAVRIVAARDAVLAAHRGRAVAVMAHSGPIRALLRDALDAGASGLWRIRVDLASVTVIRYWADGGTEVAAVNLTASLWDPL